jgi:hypothetical protein
VGKLIDEITKDWEWLSFLAQYCAGRNIGKAFCQDVKWWALGIAGWIWKSTVTTSPFDEVSAVVSQSAPIRLQP